jgi:hypothetical protein
MYPGSAIHTTGQAWKVHVGSAAYLAGAAIALAGIFGGLAWVLAGFAVGFFGGVFCCLSIRCPQCGAHWYGRAVNKLQFGWAKRLFTETQCSSCGYTGKTVGA